MDQPGLDPARHERALRALARVNRLSGTARRVWALVRDVQRERGAAPGPVRVLDVACGGGEVLADVARRARRRGAAVDLAGCDVSPRALEHARAAAPGARFFRLDARDDSLPAGYDLLCSSLFLHHLSDEEVVGLLAKMKEATGRALLVEDLRRSRAGWLLARWALAALTRSDVARTDGPRSVEAAFRIDEMQAICRRAGLEGAVLRPCWPQRFTLLWTRP